MPNLPFQIAHRFAVACCYLCLAAPAGADNLVANPGFESTRPGADGPADWAFAWKATHSDDAQLNPDKEKPDFGLDGRVFHGGSRSFRIGVARPKDDGALTATRIAADPAVKVYRATAWIRTEGLEKTTARLAAVFLGENGKWLGADYTMITADEDHDWRKYSAFCVPSKGTREIRLRLWLNFEYTGTGTVWFDDVSFAPTDLEGLPPLQYHDPGSPPPADDADLRRGYVPFVRSTLETVYPGSLPRPGELDKPVRLIGFPGQRQAATFSLHALKDLAELTLEAGTLESDDGHVIEARNVRANPVRCLLRVGQSRWGPLADNPMVKPVYVEDTTVMSVRKGTTGQVWITVAVPAETRPGDYRGKVTLKSAISSWSMPIELKVYPFSLPEVEGVAFGMYSRLHEDDRFMDSIYADMRQHGMTTVGLCCSLGAEMEFVDGEARVILDDRSDLVRTMRAYVKAGFPEPVCWLMGSDVLRFAQSQGPLDSDAFAAAYKGVILAVLRHSEAAGWPEIVFQPVDEPFEHTKGLPAAKRCLQILKSIPGVRTEEDGPNGNPSTLEELYDLSDVLVYHDGPWVDRKAYDADAWDRFLERTRRDGKTIWFYNVDLTGYHPEAMRFGYGVGLWRGRATGVIEWAYMFQYGRGPEDSAYTNPETMFFRYPKTALHAGGPSIGWEAVREGVQDYKLLALFHRKAAEAAAGNDPRMNAAATRFQASVNDRLGALEFDRLKATAGKGRWTGPVGFLDDGTRTVSGQFKMDNGWSFSDYDEFRRLLADAIVELSR